MLGRISPSFNRLCETQPQMSLTPMIPSAFLSHRGVGSSGSPCVSHIVHAASDCSLSEPRVEITSPWHFVVIAQPEAISGVLFHRLKCFPYDFFQGGVDTFCPPFIFNGSQVTGPARQCEIPGSANR